MDRISMVRAYDEDSHPAGNLAVDDRVGKSGQGVDAPEVVGRRTDARKPDDQLRYAFELVEEPAREL